MTKQKVLISCCNGRGWIHKRLVFKLIEIMPDPRYHVTFIAPTWKPFVLGLHKTIQDFLAGPWDFLLLVDDDNPPVSNPLDLVALDLDVVGLPTPVWHSAVPGDRPYYYNAMIESGDGWRPVDSFPDFDPAQGLFQVDAVGTGCVLIARRVLQALMDRAQESDDPLNAPFMRKWSPRGDVLAGNDFMFCSRAREAGFDIWAHFGYLCEHWNEVELLEVIRSFGQMTEKEFGELEELRQAMKQGSRHG